MKLDKFLGDDDVGEYIKENIMTRSTKSAMILSLNDLLDKAVKTFKELKTVATPEEKIKIDQVLKQFNIPWNM